MAEFKGYKGGKTPASDEEVKTVRVPFFGDLNAATGPTDAVPVSQQYENIFFRAYQNPANSGPTLYAEPRPRFSSFTFVNAPAGAGRGIFSYDTSLLGVYGDTIYLTNTVGSAATALISGIPVTTRFATFSRPRPGAADQRAACLSGGVLYLITVPGGVVTPVILPFLGGSPTAKMVFLGGRYYTIRTDGTIWNSAVDDGSSWLATAYITAQMNNGKWNALAIQNNYIIAFSDKGFQMFVDAGYPAPASPLQNVESLAQSVGCAYGDSVAWTENKVFWVGYTQGGNLRVCEMEGLSQVKTISTDSIERILNEVQLFSSQLLTGYIVNWASNVFYVLQLQSTNFSATFVYDIEKGIWIRLSTGASSSPIPVFCSSSDTQSTGTFKYLLHDTNGRAVIMSTSYGIGDSFAAGVEDQYTRKIILNPLDFGTHKRKEYVSAELIMQSVFPNPYSASSFNLQYSDQFMNPNTMSAPGRTLTYNPTSAPGVRPYTTRLGSSRRRQWQLTQTDNDFFSCEGIEFTYRIMGP